MAVFLTFWSCHMNIQRKCHLGYDAMHYFTFLCCWLQRTMVVTFESLCGIHKWTGNVQFHSCAHAAIIEEEDKMMQQRSSRNQSTVFLLACLFVSSASRVSSFSWPLGSGLSFNTCLFLCGWNLYPNTSASVKILRTKIYMLP